MISRFAGDIKALELLRNMMPVKIGISYAAMLVAATLLCCQFETLAEYASRSKPYSILFTEYIRKGLDNKSSKRVIFFGDSSLFYPPYRQADKGDFLVHTPALLESALSKQALDMNVRVSEWAFASASMYHYYCMFYKAAEYSPDLLIIPINWNSFGRIWMRLARDDYPELCAIVPLDNGLRGSENPVRLKRISLTRQLQYKLEIFSLYPIGLRGWAREKLNAGSARNAATSDAEEQEFTERKRLNDQKFYQDAYPWDITENDENCQFIRAIVELASRRGVKILFYISPLNEEYLESVGYLDRKAFEASKQNIIEATKGRGIHCMDLSGFLKDEDFRDSLEHYFIDARKRLAETLAPKVLEILNEHPPITVKNGRV